jgi:uncharacterized membrane protein
MPYREKLSWLTLISLLIAATAYFGIFGPAVEFGKTRLLDIVWSYGPVAAVHGLVVLAGYAALALTPSGEPKAPADERDRAIERRSTSAAYFVLLIGMLLVGMVMPFTEPPYKIINTALFVIVLAEVVRDTVMLFGYRRGLNGQAA